MYKIFANFNLCTKNIVFNLCTNLCTNLCIYDAADIKKNSKHQNQR